MASIAFSGYRFSVQVLSTRFVYEARAYQIDRTAGGIIAHAAVLFFGVGTQKVIGNLELHVREVEAGIFHWHATATTPEPIKGIKIELETLPINRAILPGGSRVELPDGKAYAVTFPFGAYPSRVRPTSGIPGSDLPSAIAQLLVFEGPQHAFVLRSEDYPPRVQRYWLHRQGTHATLVVYSEANASERETSYTTPVWMLEAVDDWLPVVERHAAWMQKAYGVRPLHVRDDVPQWLHNLCLNVSFAGDANDGKLCMTFADMEQKLREIAPFFDPQRTHVHVVGWDGRWDYTWPAFEPDPLLGGPEGFRQLMATAHELGYYVGPHLNLWGLGFEHPSLPDLEHFLDHQVRDSAGRRMSWAYDWDGDEVDEEIFAYISPDSTPWREYLIDRILKFTREYDIDAVHLDQATSFINDTQHNHWRGVCALYQQLRAALPPAVALSGEGSSEIVAHLYPLTGGWPADEPRMYRTLIGQFVRQFPYGYPLDEHRGIYGSPWKWNIFQWRRDAFDEHLQRAEESGFIPTLQINDHRTAVDSEQAQAVFAAAGRFRERLNN